MLARILYSILLIALVLFAPYWLYLPALVLGAIVFSFYWESLILALFVDDVYGAETFPLLPLSLAILLILMIVPIVKERLRFHA